MAVILYGHYFFRRQVTMTSELCFGCHGHETHGTEQSAGYGLPVTILALFVAEIVDVGIFEATPLDAATVVIGDTVGREIGHLDVDAVLSGAEVLLHISAERYRPKGVDRCAVDDHTGTLAHITQFEQPFVARHLGKVERDGIGRGTTVD